MGHALVINVFSTLSGRETVNGWSGHSGHITGLKSGVNERSNTSYKHLTPAQNRKRFRELVKQKMSPGFPAQATFLPNGFSSFSKPLQTDHSTLVASDGSMSRNSRIRCYPGRTLCHQFHSPAD